MFSQCNSTCFVDKDKFKLIEIKAKKYYWKLLAFSLLCIALDYYNLLVFQQWMGIIH